MKILQFFINPEISFETYFDCFCFEPKNLYERKLGSLYIIGEIKTTRMKEKKFLKELAYFLKETFYKKAGLKGERALRETLKEGNSFLEKRLRERNSDWLRKMNLAILNLKNKNLNFTKVGEIKIQLVRGGKLYELDKKIKTDSNIYFSRIFGKMASGRLIEDDIILVENKKIFDFFKKEGFLKKEEILTNENLIKKFFWERKEKLKDVYGIFFVLSLTKERGSKKSKIESQKEQFSLKEALLPFLKEGGKMKETIKKEVEKLLSNEKWRLIFIFLFALLFAFLSSRIF